MSSTSRRHVDPSGRPSTSTPRSSGKKTPRSSAARAGSKGQSDDGEELIVTRGLQEILDSEMQAKRTAPTGRPSKSRRAPGHAPNFVFCYLCGRQFGKASIDIHRPQCYLKKMIQWERADPATRGQKPVDPETHEKRVQSQLQAQNAMDGAPVGGAGGPGRKVRGKNDDIEAYNMVQMDAYNKESLSPCPNCGRTFLPDRLQVHLRSCKPGHTAKPIRAAPAAASAAAPGSPASPPPTDPSSGPKPPATTATKKRGAPPSAAAASTTAAAAPSAEDQPIRASGSYAIPADADIDAVPPGSGNNTPSRAGGAGSGAARARRGTGASSAGAPASGENTPIRASGSYAIPTNAGEDSVPPDAASSPPKGSSATRHSAPKPRRVSIIEPVDSDADSDDIQFAEEEPPVRGVASERRLSMSAEREALDESSTPSRPAMMEQSLSDSQSEALAQHAAHLALHDEAQEVDDADDDYGDDDVVVSEEPPARAPARASASGGRGGANSQGASSAPRHSVASKDAEDAEQVSTPRKTIPLNNVSRFKNVQSKLKQQLAQPQEASNLTPCQYCGRTFAPERVAKHESVCLERNKAAARTPRRDKKAVKKPASLGNAQPASAPAAAGPNKPATAAATAARFCDQCGTKLSSSAQKFCGSCGNKL